MGKDDSVKTLIAMGFSESIARTELDKHGGNLDHTIDSLLLQSSSITLNEDLSQNGNDFRNGCHTVGSDMSQFTFNNGRSACTCIAITGATLGLKELTQKASHVNSLKDIFNEVFINKALFSGVEMYSNKTNSNDGVEHMSVEETLQDIPQYCSDVQLIGGVHQGILSRDVRARDTSIQSILTSCRLEPNANKSKWMAVIMTKTPETVTIFLPPTELTNVAGNEVFNKYVLFDSHPRPQLFSHAHGSYLMICNTLNDLVKVLDKLFPEMDLGTDVGEIMSIMYNSFDMYAFQLKS